MTDLRLKLASTQPALKLQISQPSFKARVLPGIPGDDGVNATIAVGTVTTLSTGSPATVVNVGTSSAAIFDFGIPQGAPGGVTPSALTRVNDTNVTLTLGGTPATALLQPASLTLGWSGRLALSRLATGTAGYMLQGNGASDPAYAGFLQAGTGAITRTWQDKAREIVSVDDFGAVGDGVTNDTAAIQAAIDAAEVAGGFVFFPRGSYKVTTITVGAGNVWLGGEGPSATQIIATNTNTNIVEFSGSFIYGGIRDLTITGAGSSSSAGAGLAFIGVGAIFAERLVIQNVYNGFHQINTTACRAIGVDIANFVNNAFIHGGTGNNPYFHNCTTFQNAPYAPGGASFHLSDSEGFWLDNCVSSLAMNGILCAPGNGEACINAFVSNCDFDASADDGILISTTGTGEVANLKFVNCRGTFSGGKGVSINGGANCDGISFVNCELSKNVEEGVWINDARHVQFSNCQVLGNAATGTPSINGINVLGGDGILLSGIHSGAYPDAGGNNQVYGLKIQSSFTGGLLVDNCDFRGNATGAVSNDSTSPDVRINNCLGHVLPWVLVPKTSFESRSNTATLANDSALQFPMLANTNYQIRMRVFFSTGATADFKYALTGPASPSLVLVVRKHIDPSALTTLVTTSEGAYTASTAVAGGAGTGGGYIEFDIYVRNGANAGTFAFQWAQNTSDAAATVVIEGSYLEYRKL